MAMPNPVVPEEDEFVRELTNHQTAILAYIRSLVSGWSGARDILQEVNVTLWQKRSVFVPGTNFKAWAFQIARYHLLNHRRRLARQGWLVFDEDLMEDMAAELDNEPFELEDRHIALRQCLRKLRPQDRELLQHRYASGAPLEEYARATKRSTGTLKAILFKLRAALRDCIERQMSQPGGVKP